jgi:hypothetical protein
MFNPEKENTGLMISVTIPIQIYHNQAAALDNVYKIAEALN